MFIVFLILFAVSMRASHTVGISGVTINSLTGVTATNGRLELNEGVRAGTVTFNSFNIPSGATLTCGKHASTTGEGRSPVMFLRCNSGMTVAGTLHAESVNVLLHTTSLNLSGVLSAAEGYRMVVFTQQNPTSLLDVMIQSLAGDVDNLLNLSHSDSSRVVWTGRGEGLPHTPHVQGEVYVNGTALPENMADLIASGQSLTLITPHDGSTPFFIVGGGDQSGLMADTFGAAVSQIIVSPDGTTITSEDGVLSLSLDEYRDNTQSGIASLSELSLEAAALAYVDEAYHSDPDYTGEMGSLPIQFGYLSDGAVAVPTLEQAEAAAINLGLSPDAAHQLGTASAAFAEYYGLSQDTLTFATDQPLIDYRQYPTLVENSAYRTPQAVVAEIRTTDLIADVSDVAASSGALVSGDLAPPTLITTPPVEAPVIEAPASIDAPVASSAEAPVASAEAPGGSGGESGNPEADQQPLVAEGPVPASGEADLAQAGGPIMATVNGEQVELASPAALETAIRLSGGAENFVAENAALVETYPGGTDAFLSEYAGIQ